MHIAYALCIDAMMHYRNAEMGTSDTFIDLPIFDTYRIQKKVLKYQTSKVS
jgi:hypothetical protein